MVTLEHPDCALLHSTGLRRIHKALQLGIDPPYWQRGPTTHTPITALMVSVMFNLVQCFTIALLSHTVIHGRYHQELGYSYGLLNFKIVLHPANP